MTTKSTKLLSIIIPTYNMENYLPKCLASLVIPDSTLRKQLEVLVVIDGATDHSSAIAHDYATQYPEMFVVIDKSNGNYGSCINVGLKKATGKYIKVLDADDSFYTENFEKYLHVLQQQDVDLVVNDYAFVNPDGQVTRTVHFGMPTKKTLTLEAVPFNRPYDNFEMHAVTYRTDNLRKLGYHQTEGISYTDAEWMFLPMTMVHSVYYFSDGPLYAYLIGREGQTIDPSVALRHIDHTIKSLEAMMIAYDNTNSSGIQRKYLDIRLKRRIRGLYNGFIWRNNTILPIEKLQRFDANCKAHHPTIYQASDHYRVRGYRLIHYWRKNGSIHPLILMLMRLGR